MTYENEKSILPPLLNNDCDDVEIICRAMQEENFSDYISVLRSEFEIIDSPSWELLAENKNYIPIAAFYGDEFVGGLLVERKFDLFRKPTKFYFLRYFAVEKTFRQKGVGKKIVQYVESLAEKEGITRIELTSANFRTVSHKFYESIGFTVKRTKVFIKEAV